MLQKSTESPPNFFIFLTSGCEGGWLVLSLVVLIVAIERGGAETNSADEYSNHILQWEDETVRERTGHLPSYAKA